MKLNGGADGDRTHDLMNAIHALSQLSYSPTRSWVFEKITQRWKKCQIQFSSHIYYLGIDIWDRFSYITFRAGVVKLVDARDSKSRGASTPCRFDSDLRHHRTDKGFRLIEKNQLKTLFIFCLFFSPPGEKKARFHVIKEKESWISFPGQNVRKAEAGVQL